ncbi:MAG: photosystem P840 reaction-center cytochrome c-551 [Bryobacteraceae bacterium]|jgi:ferredoxin-NADP reductase/mono/diheme cytochrome c family protein
MIDSSTSVWLGIAFVLIGAINVWLILQVSTRVRDAKASSRLVAAHRIGGYIFIALFCAMGYFMVDRLGDSNGGVSPATTIHLTLAMVLSPLLFIKVLVARYYKSYYSFLFSIGLVIFVLSFVLIGITAGPYLAHQTRMQTVSLAAIDLPPVAIDMNLAAATMEKRCSKCHSLDRIAGARKDTRGWVATVNRMRALPDSGISEADSRIIVSYLATQMAPKGTAGAAALEVSRALVDQRCGRCHGLDRVYTATKTQVEWSATVARMAGYAAGSAGAIQPGEDQQIIGYLSATRTPDSGKRSLAQAAASPPAGRSKTQGAPGPDNGTSRIGHNRKAIGFISLVCLGMLTLAIRRPSKSHVSNAKSGATVGAAQQPVAAVRVIDSSPGEPLILRLASITPQTSDSKTLRFIVPADRKLNARPGQFLTFSFLFDGKKVLRSYSICSSPASSGYVEITPKRVAEGCVSLFLNDRVSVGLTVEAKGPFGQFYFDENKHRNVVLIAAGSGITPMMAMLRYMDDLCVQTNVTLLYCVRTGADVMFEGELEQIRSRVREFQYHILLSQPHAGWPGPRGHISREFIGDKIKDLNLPDFFLCGPPPFMDTLRAILIGLGVMPERIMQESFGGSAPKSAAPISTAAESETDALVEFARSGKTFAVRGGQTLLEAAEEHGVGIPFSCRQGQCGTCRTRLLAGKVRMDAEEGLDPVSRSQGFVLTCVGHARGAVRLDA